MLVSRVLRLMVLLQFVSLLTATAAQPAYGQLSTDQRELASRLRPAVQQHLDRVRESQHLNAKDISNWEVSDIYTGAASNTTYLYLQQTCNSVRVFNAVSPVSMREGQVLSFFSRFVNDIASRVNTTMPSLSPEKAIRSALRSLSMHYSGELRPSLRIPSLHKYIYPEYGISTAPIQVTLYVLPRANDARLVWNVNIAPVHSEHWWNLRIDAVTGELIDKNDWTIHCDFGAGAVPATTSFSTTIQSQSVTRSSATASSSFLPIYRVYPFPTEAPSFGASVLLTNPADVTASPYGWHDNNGQPGDEFTTTQGNNVWAYDDTANVDQPGSFADGGATMNFDFPVNFSQAPSTYMNASLTNLFYVNNRVHDILFHYGLDEAGGNFQTLNYSGQGSGGDQVLAECQDGGGTNNANFSTPDDGQNGVMQMYLWTGASSATLTVNAPSGIAGNYVAIPGGFGPSLSAPITADLVLVDDGTAPNSDGCDPLQNASALAGKIAVIDRGTCTFVSKVTAVQNAGAIAAIIINNVAGSPFSMGGTGTTTIPAVMISQADGAIIKGALATGTVNGTLAPPAVIVQDVDGSLDNGVVAHEYGHGVSNRLTGGPNNSNCLNNGEQGGEGWSDWFALMYTIEPGDHGSDARGMGTYAIGEPTSGSGIRRYPYSTDMTINPQTYADLAVSSEVHDIGEIWCVTLWDLTWALIDQYGFDPDWINGTGGNNIALKLVMEGMKLQPCGPGFLDGRDAILAADNNLYAGTHRCLIWSVFARRGMGANALQGSAGTAGDETADFTTPSFCQIPTSAPLADFSSDITTTCYGTVHFSDQSTNIAQNWLWDFGDGSTSTQQNPAHTYTGNGTFTVTLIASNTLGADTLVRANYITITSPAAPVVSNVPPVCPGTAAVLNALVASGDSVEWYDVTGANLVGTGTPFTTPPLNTADTFLARAYTPTALQAVGPANNSFAGGGYHNTGFEGKELFTTYVPLRLVSVWVDANGPAVRNFNLYNSSGTLLQTAAINVPNGQSRVTLNFDIPLAGNYQLGVTAGSNLYRNNAGASYPYSIAGLVSITASNSTSNPATYYYYCYDWRVQELPCKSAAATVPVGVETDTVAPFTATSIGSLDYQFYYPTPTGVVSYDWDFGDGSTGTGQSPIHTYAQTGVYQVTLNVTFASGCSASKTETVTITLNGMPSVVIPGVSVIATNGRLVIRPGQIASPLTISVFSSIGQELIAPAAFAPSPFELELPANVTTVLIVRIETKDQVEYRKVFTTH